MDMWLVLSVMLCIWTDMGIKLSSIDRAGHNQFNEAIEVIYRGYSYYIDVSMNFQGIRV